MFPELAVVALAENPCAQSAAGGDAEVVHLTLPAAVQETAAQQERLALWGAGGLDDGCAKLVH